MALIETLAEQIADPALRKALSREIAQLKKRLSWGLVFEQHIPETTLLLSGTIRPGTVVYERRSMAPQSFRVEAVEGDDLVVMPTASEAQGVSRRVARSDVLIERRLGEPIYPALSSLGQLRRGPPGRPSHAVIEGENYHALQLLTYTHAGQVDVIYLDPPYNSGARDWRYNNAYVDANDSYRHSKWLSMMEKRLLLCRQLLRPDGVLVITIDENEVYHLGMLLEQTFRDCLIQMVTIVINPKGTAKLNFSRVDEHAMFVIPDTGQSIIARLPPWPSRTEVGVDDEPTHAYPDAEVVEADETEDSGIADEARGGADVAPAKTDASADEYLVLYLRRRGAQSSARTDRPRQFYAILVDEQRRQVVGIGPELRLNDAYAAKRENGILWVYPVDAEGNDRVWRYGRDTMQALIELGAIRVGRYNAAQDTYTLNHWKLRSGPRVQQVRTVWWRTEHDAGTHGTSLLARMLGRRNAFPFPKSLYAVRDTLETVVKGRPNALVVDAFAGSGTTLHATMLLNSEDGGRRQCFLITNNEVPEEDARRLQRNGHFRGDPAFEAEGIFQLATRPRVEAAVTGKRPDGSDIPGRYLSYVGGRAMSAGFAENVEFFRVEYLDPLDVGLQRQLEQLLPVLWLQAGGIGERQPVSQDKPCAAAAGLPYAFLFDPSGVQSLGQKLAQRPDITHVFIAAPTDEGFADLRAQLPEGLETVQLYRPYLDHFRRSAR